MTDERDAVAQLGDAIGYGRLMQLAEEIWREKAAAEGLHGSEHSVGCCVAFLEPCPCIKRDLPCDWCCGSRRVTRRVREAMESR